jgi:hypothetical protein
MVPADPTITGNGASARAVHAAAIGLRAWLPVQTKKSRKGDGAFTPGTYLLHAGETQWRMGA